MSNGKLWLSLKDNNPEEFLAWEREQQIDVCACQISGSGLLHWSAQTGALRVTEVLLKKVPVDMQDMDGETALQAAVRSGHLPSVNLFIAAGANVNRQSYDGKTALMIAVARKRSACVKRLLAEGADTSIRDNTGYTVHSYATTAEMIRLLQAHSKKEPALKVIPAKSPVKKANRVHVKV